jgi:imidazolonepropionase-like amidohydrolase
LNRAAKLPGELAGAINNTGVPASVVPRANSPLRDVSEHRRAMHRAGIPIVAGTDQVVPGHSVHRELELYVKAGFTPGSDSSGDAGARARDEDR